MILTANPNTRKVKITTLRKLTDGYLPHNVSKNGDSCLHFEFDAASKWTTETPAKLTNNNIRRLEKIE